MTNSEYKKRYKQAHTKNGSITRKTNKAIKKKYIEASEIAADTVKKANIGKLIANNKAEWSKVNTSLVDGAILVSSEVEMVVPKDISKGYDNFLKIDNDYMMDAVKITGIIEITKAGINNVGASILEQVLEDQSTRVWDGTGYTFVESIWSKKTILAKDGITKLPTSVYNDYQFRVENIIRSGLQQGRDAVEIAEDITEYAKKGHDFVFKEGRYGKLKPGTYQYRKRITRKIDWRALRLIRSEMNASLQSADIQECFLNPACEPKLADWNKTIGNKVDANGLNNFSGQRCIDLQRSNPHPAEEIDFYNHANCSCYKTPVLIDQNKFVEDLKNWTPGQTDNYLDVYYNDIYLPAQ